MKLITLEGGRTRVMIAPALGGRIAQIEIHDGTSWLPLLYEPPGVPPEQRDPVSWGSFVMAPWPNRVANGEFTFCDVEYRVPASDAGGHALHGLAFDRPWQVEAIDDVSCRFGIALDERWPWSARVAQFIEIGDESVSLGVEVSGDGPLPAGVGWHPWFRRVVRAGGDVRVLVGADERYDLAPDRIPTGEFVPVSGAYDLRAQPILADRRLDDCYRDVRGPMRVAWGDIELTMTSSANVTHAVVYTPGHAVCIEPQTCAIDAFNLDAHGVAAGTAIVDDGRPLVATTEWRWRIGSS